MKDFNNIYKFMKFNLFSIIGFCICLFLVSCNTHQDSRIPVIIETDMGNDIDDALALALAHKAEDDGIIDLLMVSNHKKSLTAPKFIDIVNLWYAHPETIVANSRTPVENNTYRDYTTGVVHLCDSLGTYDVPDKKTDYIDPVLAYRKILSESKDNTVVIVSLGFATTLVQLLDSKPDQFSTMSGRDLVAKKVKYLSLMAGSYGIKDTIMVDGFRETLFDKTKKRCEFNVDNDIPSMRKLMEEWPVAIYQNPFEIGKMVMYPASAASEKQGPVFDAYKLYKKMPYDRPTWDILAMAYVLKPDMFSKSEAGTITVDENGFNHFYPAEQTELRRVSEKNSHYVLTISQNQADVLRDYIISNID